MRNLSALSPLERFFDEPFEVLLAVGALVSGSSVAAARSRPVSLAAQLSSPWMLRAWGVSVLAGGVLTLLARLRLARARTDEGLIAGSRLEVVAMVLFATTLGVYGLAILAVGAAGLAAAPLTLAWSAAFAVQARKVTRRLRTARDVLLDPPDG